MVSLIVYLILMVLLGLFFAFVIIIMKSTKRRGDTAPYWPIFFCLMITLIGPFIADELMTKEWGDEMRPAVQKAYDDGPINGDMVYYRVVWRWGDNAKVFAIGQEHENWGGTDKPIMAIYLTKKDGTWHPTEYFLLYSDRQNKDSIVFPPYR